MADKKRAKTHSSKPSLKTITPQEFIDQFVEKQVELMDAMLACIHNKEHEIIEKGADQLIDEILGAWTAQDEPDFTTHMKAQAAIFLWALLDQAYGMEVEGEDAEAEADEGPNGNGPNVAVTIALDVLRTARAIWGRPGNREPS